MCEVFKVSKSSYYAWLGSKPTKRTRENELLLKDIEQSFEKSKQSYGAVRMTAEMNSLGYTASRPRIARLMKVANLKVRRTRKYRATTDSNHKYPIAPNLLNRAFSVQRRAQVWVSDITYVKTNQGWLYLTVIIDLYDRKVIGWSMSKDMSAKSTVIAAWKMAVINRPFDQELLFHSDRGIQYACNAFVEIIKSYSGLVKQSMSRKGNCWDNAVSESFFKTIKVEWIYKHNYVNRKDAELSIFHWIETWYNKKRRHSALGYKNIDEIENVIQMFNQAA